MAEKYVENVLRYIDANSDILSARDAYNALEKGLKFITNKNKEFYYRGIKDEFEEKLRDLYADIYFTYNKFHNRLVGLSPYFKKKDENINYEKMASDIEKVLYNLQLAVYVAVEASKNKDKMYIRNAEGLLNDVKNFIDKLVLGNYIISQKIDKEKYSMYIN